jgi:hypothetical protein
LNKHTSVLSILLLLLLGACTDQTPTPSPSLRFRQLKSRMSLPRWIGPGGWEMGLISSGKWMIGLPG